LRRGFKVEAETLAVSTRSELGLDAQQRLDPALLAAHLSIPIITLHDIRDKAPDDVDHLLNGGSSEFSAATVCDGDRRLILLNPEHAAARQSNTLAHELAHVLLDHPAGPSFNDWGLRNWKQDYEDEANYLAGCLLAPRAGLIPVMKRLSYKIPAGAEHYAISVELMTQRWHQTGCKKQVERAMAKRRSS
jgi:Zn-dependent peptidase ImmA (M78 family)